MAILCCAAKNSLRGTLSLDCIKNSATNISSLGPFNMSYHAQKKFLKSLKNLIAFVNTFLLLVPIVLKLSDMFIFVLQWARRGFL
jgi:hypothetical protein